MELHKHTKWWCSLVPRPDFFGQGLGTRLVVVYVGFVKRQDCLNTPTFPYPAVGYVPNIAQTN